MDEKLRPFLTRVEKPARYVGGEYNLPKFGGECKARFCLCFADVYEVGMSNLGIGILYDILNSVDGAQCERCFAPWTDMGKILKENDIPLSSIETGTPLKDFDIVGFSVPYEMSFTTILYMLDLAGIPFRASDRGENFPIIVAGGPIAANPEPIADFFDAIFIGDGEESDAEFLKLYMDFKGDKRAFLKEATKIQGVYVPALSEVKDGIAVTPVKKAVVRDLDKARFPTKPLVPNMEVIHDRGVIELYRGCYAGCRFCQACFFYRPIRYREKPTVEKIAEELIKNTGYDEIGLSSLSSGDYDDIAGLISDLKSLTEQKNVNLQTPSLRLDSFTAKIAERAKRTSLTFAPEAGTQRLRDVINKNITEKDIEESMKIAFGIGYNSLKLYFMLGLPTETDEDVLGIAEVVRKIRRIYMETTGRKDITMNVSTAMFIPKPATPFQWAEQISEEEMYRRQNLLKSELFKIKGVHYAWHGADFSVIEGVFARGDRALSGAVEAAYKKGAYLESWSERFNKNLWKEALSENNSNIEKYTGIRKTEEILPWDFIDIGVKKSYLLQEWERSKEGLTTPPCKHKCNGCGASKFAPCRLIKEEGNS